ncbi:MAG TPA: hypothetical protein VF484_07325 [Candidatus Limnocylindrales bacterium]
MSRVARRRWIAATIVVLLGQAWILPAGTAAFGTATATMGTTIRNSSNVIIATAQWEKTGYHLHVKLSGGAGVPTGTVSFASWSSGGCNGIALFKSPTPLVGGIADLPTLVADTIGTLSYRVHYDGDATYQPKTSACLGLTVIKQKPVVTTKVRDSHGTAGTVFPTGELVHDSGAVTGVNATPTDIVYVSYFSDGSCTTMVGLESVATLTSGKFDTPLNSHVFSKPGTHSYRATYPGDTHFQSATGPCEPFTIKAPSTVKATVRYGITSVTTIPVGKIPFVRVHVSGAFANPLGKIALQIFSNGTCTGMPDRQTARQSVGLDTVDVLPWLTPPPAGSYSFVALYFGDSEYLPAKAACATLTVVKNLVSSVTPSFVAADGSTVTAPAVGAALRVRVAFAGPVGTPTGKVHLISLQPGCTGVGVSAAAQLDHGVVEFPSVTYTQAGQIAYSISYEGDATYEPVHWCWSPTVLAAGQAPDPNATPVPLGTGSPGAAESPAASAPASASEVPSESAAASASPEATAESSGLGGSAGPTATPAPTGTPATTTDSGPWLLIGAIVLVAIVVLLLASRATRRSKPTS